MGWPRAACVGVVVAFDLVRSVFLRWPWPRCCRGVCVTLMTVAGCCCAPWWAQVWATLARCALTRCVTTVGNEDTTPATAQPPTQRCRGCPHQCGRSVAGRVRVREQCCCGVLRNRSMWVEGVGVLPATGRGPLPGGLDHPIGGPPPVAGPRPTTGHPLPRAQGVAALHHRGPCYREVVSRSASACATSVGCRGT